MKLSNGNYMNIASLNKAEYSQYTYVLHKYKKIVAGLLKEVSEVYIVVRPYRSKETGEVDIYTCRTLGGATTFEISADDIEPMWLQRGDKFKYDGQVYEVRELFYNSYNALTVETIDCAVFGINDMDNRGYDNEFELL